MTQSDQDSREYVPVVHVAREPEEVQVEPAGQGSQEVAAVLSAYRPAMQATGEEAAVAQACPEGQGEQADEVAAVV